MNTTLVICRISLTLRSNNYCFHELLLVWRSLYQENQMRIRARWEIGKFKDFRCSFAKSSLLLTRGKSLRSHSSNVLHLGILYTQNFHTCSKTWTIFGHYSCRQYSCGQYLEHLRFILFCRQYLKHLRFVLFGLSPIFFWYPHIFFQFFS